MPTALNRAVLADAAQATTGWDVLVWILFRD